jgi:hypothetical protein
MLNLQPSLALLVIGVIALAVVSLFLLLNARSMIPHTVAPAPIESELRLMRSPWQFAEPRLSIEPPRCYDMPARQLVCLGQIYNPTSQSIDAVSLTLDTHQQTTEIALEQNFIPPHSYAPYHVRFDMLYEETTLVLAQLATQIPSRKIAYKLEIIEERSEFVRDSAENATYGRYVITAQVRNPYSRPIPSVQVISSLTDHAGYLAGYRIQELQGGIKVGEIIPIRMEITPIVMESGFKHSLSVLAWDNEVGE